MKEKKRAIIALALSVVLIVAITVGVVTSKKEDSVYASRPLSITLSYYAGGYGSDWLQAVAKDYMDHFNEDVYIKLVPSYDNSTANADIRSGYASYDIYQIEVGMFELSDMLTDLTDLVYNKSVIGDEEEVMAKDKITPENLERYQENGRYYQLPQTSGLGWNWVINLDTVNEAFGEGNWSVPKTTDQLFAFGDKCLENGIYLTCGALADTQGGDYLKYAFQCWFAQMTGEYGYNQFFDGNYLNDAGEYVLAEDHPYMFTQRRAEIESVYAVANRLCFNETVGGKDEYYLYTNSDSLNYRQADQVFYGGGYGKNKTKIAMLYTGAWIETEVLDLIEDGVISMQDFRAIKMPVISSIISRTPTITDDSMLSEVIDYVDNVGERPGTVSDEDIEVIREARSMVCENISRQFVVPKNSKNQEEAAEFLRYLMSNRAQKLSAQKANGINQLPYGYDPSLDPEIVLTDYVKSVYEINQNAIIIDYGLQYKKFKLTCGLQWYYDSYTFGNTLATGLFIGKSTAPDKIYDETYKYYEQRWQNLIATYKAKVGLN